MFQNEEMKKTLEEMSKRMFIDSFNAMTGFLERMTDLYLSMTPLVPDEGRQVVKNLLGTYKSRREEYIKLLIARQMELLGGPPVPGKAEAVDLHVILRDVEEKVLGKLDFGFEPEVLSVLSNPEASRKEIEALKGKMSPEILAKVVDIANSAYFGTLKKGKAKSFYDAVMILGMKHAEILIIYAALFIMAKGREAELILAKSFARYVLGGYVYASDLGLSKEATYRVEMGCLFMDIGKIVFQLYKTRYEEDYNRFGINEELIERCHHQLGIKLCGLFHIPDELIKIIFHRQFDLDAKHVSLTGIMKTVYYLIESLFEENSGRLVLTSPMPDKQDRVMHTFGVVIRDLFAAVGLSAYLEIIDKQQTAAMLAGDSDD